MRQPAWFLNLDAELELATAGSYTRKRLVSQQLHAQAAACELLTAGDPVHSDAQTGDTQLGARYSVFCWCPTPSAVARLEQEGLVVVRGPSVEVLRRANRKDWIQALAPASLERKFITPEDDWRQLLRQTRAADGAWRLKRAYGFAGRGQRRFPAEPSADDLRWLRESLAKGGVLREADVRIVDEFSLHGYVDAEELIMGRPVQFFSDRFGAPESFRMARGMAAVHRQELSHAAARVAEQLRSFGYHGPFGIDAFTWHEATHVQLNAVSDVNARFTLAWSLGMSEERARALERYASQS